MSPWAIFTNFPGTILKNYTVNLAAACNTNRTPYPYEIRWSSIRLCYGAPDAKTKATAHQETKTHKIKNPGHKHTFYPADYAPQNLCASGNYNKTHYKTTYDIIFYRYDYIQEKGNYGNYDPLNWSFLTLIVTNATQFALEIQHRFEYQTVVFDINNKFLLYITISPRRKQPLIADTDNCCPDSIDCNNIGTYGQEAGVCQKFCVSKGLAITPFLSSVLDHSWSPVPQRMTN